MPRIPPRAYWETADGGERAQLYAGDALRVLQGLPSQFIQMCVTSPPYWGLRSYEAGAEEIGREKTPEEYISNLVAIFREVYRVLRDDGTLWLNLGDSYSGSGGNLVGIPWRVAFALREEGWVIRQDIIWAKPDPMPESVKNRCTRSHEYVFLLTKGSRYYIDMEAIKDVTAPATVRGGGFGVSTPPGWSGNTKVVGAKGGPRPHDPTGATSGRCGRCRMGSTAATIWPYTRQSL